MNSARSFRMVGTDKQEEEKPNPIFPCSLASLPAALGLELGRADRGLGTGLSLSGP